MIKHRQEANVAELFGFEIVPSHDAKELVINQIHEEGVLARWNRSFPERAALPGDFILKVNDVSFSASHMSAELEQKSVVLVVEANPAGPHLF